MYPLIVYEFKKGKLIKFKGSIGEEPGFDMRGGSPFIEFKGKHIAIGHFKGFKAAGKLYYRHFFVTLDENLEIEEETPPFFIHRPGLEFASGICCPDGSDEFMISYGRSDRFAILQSFKIDQITQMLSAFSNEISIELPPENSQKTTI